MSVYKMTAIFRQITNKTGVSQGNRIAGWTESLYRDSNDFPIAKTRFEEWCAARATLLGNGGSITGQRYELINPSGRTQTGARVFPGFNLPTDVPQMALTFTVPCVSTPNIRRFTLRGIWDGLVVEGEYQPVAGFPALLQALVSALNGFSIRAANITAPYVQLMSIDATGAFICASPLTFAVGDRVTVKGVRRDKATFPTGEYYIGARTDATHGTLVNWTWGVGFDGAVRPQLVTYPFFDWTAQVDPVVTVRKVGRPLSGYRGRASRRA